MKLASPEKNTPDQQINGLSFLWLEITQKCNLTCRHCYAGSSPSQPLSHGMATSDWIRVISQARGAGCGALQFIGGEPTLYPDLPQLIQHAANEGFSSVEVFTNASTITDARLKLFREYGVHVACSFYSDDSSTHDLITRKPGSFHRTKNGIAKVLEYGLNLRVGIIEMEQNHDHHDRAASLLRGLGVTRISTDRIRGIGRGTSPKAPLLPKYGDICGHCWQGKLCVTDSGDAYPCIMARKTRVGNVIEHSLSEILESKSLGSFRREVRETFGRKEIKNCSPDCSPSQYCGPFDSCGPKEPCYPANICGPQVPCAPRD